MKAPDSSHNSGAGIPRWLSIGIVLFCLIGMAALSAYYFGQPPYPDAHNPPERWSWDWWTHPLEINAANRLPLFENTRINDAELLDMGEKIWIVGDQGLIKHSKDAGATWQDARINWNMPEKVGIPVPDEKLYLRPRPNEKLPTPPKPRPLPPLEPSAPASESGQRKPQAELGSAQRLEVAGEGVAAKELPAAASPPAQDQQKAQEPAIPAHQIPQRSAQVPPDLIQDQAQAGLPLLSSNLFSIDLISVSNDGIYAWALAFPYVSAGGFEVVVLKSSNSGRDWSVDTVFQDSKANFQPAKICAGARGSAWLSLGSFPLMRKSNPDDKWKPYYLQKRPFRIDSMSFDSFGLHGWIVGSDSKQPSAPQELWRIEDTRMGIIETEAKLPEEGTLITEVFDALTPDSGIVKTSGKNQLLWQTQNSGKSWASLDYISGENALCDDVGDYIIGYLTNSSGEIGPDTKPQVVVRLFGGMVMSGEVPVPDLTRVEAGEHSFLLRNKRGVLHLMRGPDWIPRSLTRQFVPTHDKSKDEADRMFVAQSSTYSLPYSRFPAPIYYPLAAAVLAVAGLAVRRLPEQNAEAQPKRERAVADYFITDSPLQAGQPDALGSEKLALGLADYLRNQKTGLPLTVAITGAWGSGKSSIMNLLNNSLRKNGCYPVEFNAWHHQNEQHILAAMLDSIRSQAVPPVWHPDGMLFRWRLALLRLRSRWFSATGYGMLTVGGTALVAQNSVFFESLLQSGNVVEIMSGMLTSVSGFGGLAGVGALLAVLYRTVAALGAFGVDPAKLLVSATEKAKISDLKGQTSLRYQFAREFSEVTQAMEPDMRMILFIDDLDRCLPEHMMTVLENINFLTSAGKCAVVIGMDDEAVKDCLTTHLEWRMKLKRPLDQWTREERHEFACQWLEKMIQVSVGVPQITQSSIKPFVKGAAGDTSERATAKSLLRLLCRRFFLHYDIPLKAFLMLAAFIGAGYLGTLVPLTPPIKTETPAPGFVFSGQMVESEPATPKSMRLEGSFRPAPKDEKKPVPVPPVAPSTPETSTAPTVPQSLANQTITPKILAQADETKPTGPPTYQPGLVSWDWWILFAVTSAMPLLLMLWKVIRRRLHRPVQESTEVLDAFEEWLHPLGKQLNTPRSMKGFLNKVRFYDMLSRTGKDRTERLPIPPEQIVAFGALGYYAPETIADPAASLPADLSAFADCEQAAQEVLKLLHGKDTSPEIKAHFQLLSQSWKKRMPSAPATVQPVSDALLDP